MPRVNGNNTIRMTGLATGMDTDKMVKEMLSAEQSKVDKAKQKEQTIKWQQETYREVIKDVQGFQDKYFSVTSPTSILSSKAWNTLSVSSSNENILSATSIAGAEKVNYKFDVQKLAEPAKMVSIKFSSPDQNLALSDTIKFKIDLGGEKGYKSIELGPTSTVQNMIDSINETMNGQVKASYSEMTGKFTIETNKTGKDAKISIVNDGDVDAKKALSDIGFNIEDTKGTNAKVEVTLSDGTTKTLDEESNTFVIDKISYNINAIGKANIYSKEDVKPAVDNMKNFVKDYNKIMDKVYDLVTEKKNKDYPPLTDAQKKDMSDEEIERWEKKAKEGLLRNDSEMRSFMNKMQSSIFGGKEKQLSELGLMPHEDYNKRGQLSINEDKFTKALQNDGDKVYSIFAKNSNSVMEKMKDTMYEYVGTSSSVFARKAGIEKTSSTIKNYYSEQLKRQEDTIKMLQRKMDDREDKLYKQFGQLEAAMNKLNSQMNYFAQG